jgi:CRISPR type III-B/RAMP module-associated protein Cmr5
MSRTLEQKRATYALTFVTGFTGKKGELFTHIQKTPIRILQNGLGQALAFLLSNNENKTGNAREPSGWLYDHLQEWLCGALSVNRPSRIYNGQQCNLMKQLIEGDRTQYMFAQEETLKLFTWLKKFADAYLDTSS